MEGIQWFTFDHAEARGELGVRDDCYGLGIYVKDDNGSEFVDGLLVRRVALVDLYYLSPEGKPSDDKDAHIAVGVHAGSNGGCDNITPVIVRVYDDRVKVEIDEPDVEVVR